MCVCVCVFLVGGVRGYGRCGKLDRATGSGVFVTVLPSRLIDSISALGIDLDVVRLASGKVLDHGRCFFFSFDKPLQATSCVPSQIERRFLGGKVLI